MIMTGVVSNEFGARTLSSMVGLAMLGIVLLVLGNEDVQPRRLASRFFPALRPVQLQYFFLIQPLKDSTTQSDQQCVGQNENVCDNSNLPNPTVCRLTDLESMD